MACISASSFGNINILSSGIPAKREQRGAVEACWAHNPEVGGSKPLAANRFSAPPCRWTASLVNHCISASSFGNTKILSSGIPAKREQRGAVEACWAHNPEVGGSKPLAANRFSVLHVVGLLP
ncbi:hypothetical protein RB195_000590 [Necator americanus]|uniref:Uncharacterized protein n=1 Tax=Necator americanus TaxID=51031 RepID=A0ABR1DC61_NECAM